jgi:hypothetical protein
MRRYPNIQTQISLRKERRRVKQLFQLFFPPQATLFHMQKVADWSIGEDTANRLSSSESLWISTVSPHHTKINRSLRSP